MKLRNLGCTGELDIDLYAQVPELFLEGRLELCGEKDEMKMCSTCRQVDESHNLNNTLKKQKK